MPPYVPAAPYVLLPLHGIASRHDLPLPFSFVLVGAGLALVVSFVVLGVAWKRPRFSTVGGVAMPRLTRFVDAPRHADRRPGAGAAPLRLGRAGAVRRP